jgi:hypothetical protein
LWMLWNPGTWDELVAMTWVMKDEAVSPLYSQGMTTPSLTPLHMRTNFGVRVGEKSCLV